MVTCQYKLAPKTRKQLYRVGGLQSQEHRATFKLGPQLPVTFSWDKFAPIGSEKGDGFQACWPDWETRENRNNTEQISLINQTHVKSNNQNIGFFQ